VNSKETGDRGEDIASIYLRDLGYEIVCRNWKTRWCEIDIIAKKDDCIFFVEVKYRKNTSYGGGLEYITPKKMQKMHFAAELWMNTEGYTGNCELKAIAVNASDNAIAMVDAF
jgi:uncharacterized protein (TIGR00252 family)